MDEALAAWLRLREPVDAASRSAALTSAIAHTLASEDPVRVVDLATGAGSNLRFLIEHLPRNQEWTVVDRSVVLLGELADRTAAWATAKGYTVARGEARFSLSGPTLSCQVAARQLNLGTLEDEQIFEGRHLVTGSALLDLVSAEWLRALAAQCVAAGAAALFTITYDGRSLCTPADRDDEMVLVLFNHHQRTDKGLGGVAAGPEGTACAVRAFEEVGYRVRTSPSDWQLGPGDEELQRQLIDGWASAASEIEPREASRIELWRIRRREHVDLGRSRLVVGHHDIAAWPEG